MAITLLLLLFQKDEIVKGTTNNESEDMFSRAVLSCSFPRATMCLLTAFQINVVIFLNCQ